MSPIQQRARDIFLYSVRQVPAEQWDDHVATVCAGNAELAIAVQRLFQSHRDAGSFLERPAIALPETPTAEHSESPTSDGSTPMPGPIGPYKLLELIGEGGMGTVWMAEQTEPVQRKVALKIIKPGLDSQPVVARFEAERQALALMDHPNIARVFDGGTTETGRPYFVMELVKGQSITRYCDELRLTPRERLDLFVPVCQAIQHAHQKGIIHRDIKPSNVLVAPFDGKPVVKVIDFGVAKATGQRLTDKTLFTAFGAVVGTLEYMSPEQAELNNQDVDTRSDIYALGVLLYELLTGTTPLDRARLKHAAFTESLRLIREEEPPKPSTRLSDSKDRLPSISAQRQTEPAKLTRLVRGELDWIVMKALEKDRNRRYETANSFAMDVQHYLADEPVQACPPSAGYRLRKFARRNKVAIVTAGLVVAALLFGGAASVWQAIRATRAERLSSKRLGETEEAKNAAGEEAAKARAIVALLQEMLETANPDAAKGPGYSVRQMLDDFEVGLGDRLRGRPDVEGDLRMTIGRAYKRLGLLEKAEKQLQLAVELRQQTFGTGHPKVAEPLASLAWNAFERKAYPAAEKLARQALEINRSHENRDEELGRTLRILAMTIENQSNDMDEAERTWREAVDVATRSAGGKATSLVACTSAGLANCLVRRGHATEAEPIAVRAVAMLRQVHGVHTETGWGLVFLGECYATQYRFADAERAFREALTVFRRLFGGTSHRFVAQSLGKLVFALAAQYKDDEIETILRECGVDHQRQDLASADEIHSDRGRACLYRGDMVEAEVWFRRACVAGRKSRGMFDPVLTYSQLFLAGTLFFQNKQTDAREAARGVLPMLRVAIGHPNTDSGVLLAYAIALMITGSEKAEDLQAIQTLVQRIVGDRANANSDRKAFALITLAHANQRFGDRDRAIDLLREARRIASPLALLERRLAEKYLIQVLKAKGDREAVEHALRDGLVEQQTALPKGHPEIAEAQVNLAELLCDEKRYSDAVPLLLAAHDSLKSHPQGTSTSLKRRRANATERLMKLFHAWGKPEEAAKWKRELEAQQKPGS